MHTHLLSLIATLFLWISGPEDGAIRQFQIQLFDLTTRLPISFNQVSIEYQGKTFYFMTNVEGKFELDIPKEVTTIIIRAQGYYPLKSPINPKSNTAYFKLGRQTEEPVVLDDYEILDETGRPKRPLIEKRALELSETETISSSGTISSGPVTKYRTSPAPTTDSYSYDALPPVRESRRGRVKDIEIRKSTSAPIKTDPKSYSSPSAPPPPDLVAGTLTAGEVHDFSKWDQWEDISTRQLEVYQDMWKTFPAQRYTLQLSTDSGLPIADAQVQLLQSTGQLIWSSRTDNTGKAELWANMLAGEDSIGKKLKLNILYQGKKYGIKKAKRFKKGINMLQLPVSCEAIPEVDIAFVVDATGSMGDEIEYLKTELNDVIAQLKDTLPELKVRLGSVFYRDIKDEYLTRKSDLSADINQTVAFIRQQSAHGGGDGPEAVEDGLAVAIRELSWSQDARARIVFLVLDAPPHREDSVIQKMHQLMREASNKGIRIVPVTGSGINKSTEYLMRSLALATNGTYTFLTDHSGVGNPHIEPTTDEYTVEKLNALLLRICFQYMHMPACNLAVDQLNDSSLVQTNIPSQNPNLVPGKLKWDVFPNPTSGPLTFKWEEDIEHIFMTDLSGKILGRYDTRELPQLELNIQAYPEGIYFFKGISGKKHVSTKVILLH